MRSATGAIKIVDDKAQAALGQLTEAHKAIAGLEVRWLGGYLWWNPPSDVVVVVSPSRVCMCVHIKRSAQEKQGAWRRETLELLKEVEGCVT